MDAEEPDVDPQDALVEEEEVLEGTTGVEPALEGARVAALPDRKERADDDRDRQRRDHNHVDLAAAERRVRDPFDHDADHKHDGERHEVAEAQRQSEPVLGETQLISRPEAEERTQRDQVALREVRDARRLHDHEEAERNDRDDGAAGDPGTQ